MPYASYSALAREDIDSAAAYIAADSPAAAQRFNASVKQTIDLLIEFPELGAAYPHPDHSDLRAKLVNGFHQYIVFYTIEEANIHLVRVLNGARDVPRVLGE